MSEQDKEFLRLPSTYDSFVQSWSDMGMDVVPSYQQWIEALDETEDKHVDILEKEFGASFQVPPNIGAGLAAGVSALKTIGIEMPSRDDLINVAGARLKDELTKFAKGTGSRVYQSYGNNTPTGGGDGGTSESNYMGGSVWNPTGMSDKNPVVSANFDTDIPFIGADKYFLDGKEGNTPLLLKCGIPGAFDHGDLTSTDVTKTSDAQLHDYFVSAIFNEFRSEISKRVIVNTQVNAEFTADNIQLYYNANIQALCTYYFWMSVLAYTNDPRNKNEAMNQLIDSLSVTERQNLAILQRTIEQSVIPPFLHKWCFYIMGNYKQSYMPGSPMMKVFPWVFKDVGSTTPTNVNKHTFTEMYVTSAGFGSITNSIFLLRNHRELSDILARAYPDWCSPQLLMYDSTPKYDANFSQFWKNAFYLCGGEVSTTSGTGYVTKKLPEVTTLNDEFIYCADTDAPDGWVQAMQAVHAATENKTVPGFFTGTFYTVEQDATTGDLEIEHKFATQSYVANAYQISSSCIVYDANTSPTGYKDVGYSGYAQKLAQNTYSSTISATAIKKHQQYGTSLIKLQNVETIRQACFAWYDLIASDLKVPSRNKSSRSQNYMSKGKDRGNRKSKDDSD